MNKTIILANSTFSSIFYLLVFTASGDKSIKAFESKSGTCKRTFTGHEGAINCILVSSDYHCQDASRKYC